MKKSTAILDHACPRAEKILWRELRNKKLRVKFRRQHLIDQFIVDFYCIELGLFIEMEGDIHKKQRRSDKEREWILKAYGCSVIRFANREVEKDLLGVIRRIKEYIQILSR